MIHILTTLIVFSVASLLLVPVLIFLMIPPFLVISGASLVIYSVCRGHSNNVRQGPRVAFVPAPIDNSSIKLLNHRPAYALERIKYE